MPITLTAYAIARAAASASTTVGWAAGAAVAAGEAVAAASGEPEVPGAACSWSAYSAATITRAWFLDFFRLFASSPPSSGDSLDEELDFYRDDDDVAVLFIMEDGSKVWCLGNIEEVAVASGTVNEQRALAGNGASYLLGLDKVYRRNGVHVDDPKGMFILRWYKEVRQEWQA